MADPKYDQFKTIPIYTPESAPGNKAPKPVPGMVKAMPASRPTQKPKGTVPKPRAKVKPVPRVREKRIAMAAPKARTAQARPMAAAKPKPVQRTKKMAR